MRYIVSLTAEARRKSRRDEVLALLDAAPGAEILEGRGRNSMKVEMSPATAERIRESAGTILIVSEPAELRLLGTAG